MKCKSIVVIWAIFLQLMAGPLCVQYAASQDVSMTVSEGAGIISLLVDETKWAAHFDLNNQQHAGLYLKIEAEGGGAVFIDHELSHQPLQGENQISISWPVDSLLRAAKAQGITITLVGFSKIKRAELHQPVLLLDNSGRASIIAPEPRSQTSGTTGIFITIFLIILLLLTTFKLLFHKPFLHFFDIAAAFRIKPREGIFYDTRILDPSNLIFYLIYGSMLAFASISIMWTNDLLQIQSLEPNTIILTVLILALVIAVVLPFKYALISLLARLFDIKAFARIQYYDNLRIGLIMILLILGTVHFNDLFGFGKIAWEGVYVMLFVLLVLRPLMIYLKLMRVVNMNGIYLFSYLCSIELLPLFIVIKILSSAG